MKTMAKAVAALGMALGLAGCSEPENETIANTDPAGNKTNGVNPPGPTTSEGARDKQLASDPLTKPGSDYKKPR